MAPRTRPLAPFVAVERADVPAVIDWMASHPARDAPPALATDIWSTTLVLRGLRYDEADAREVIRRMSWLRESVTYHMILNEGREEGREDGRLDGERRLLVRMGTPKIGSPSPGVIAAMEAINDSQRPEQLGVALPAGASQETRPQPSRTAMLMRGTGHG